MKLYINEYQSMKELSFRIEHHNGRHENYVIAFEPFAKQYYCHRWLDNSLTLFL